MAAVPLHRQFAGQARLVRLLLWRIGDSTNIDACLTEARASNMIDEDDEAFLRKCLAVEEALRDGSANIDAECVANSFDFPITQETVARLRRCADKLNRADAA